MKLRCKNDSENVILDLIKKGAFRVDSSGRIWKNEKRAENGIGKKRYLQVRIMFDGIRYQASAHRLVWRWFNDCKTIPPDWEINHIDGNKEYNHPSNLELCTSSENRKHAFRIGLINQNGERNPASKLTSEQINEIRDLYSTGKYRQIDLAKKYSVSHQTVSKIIRGERRITERGIVSKKDHRHLANKKDPKTGKFISQAITPERL